MNERMIEMTYLSFIELIINIISSPFILVFFLFQKITRNKKTFKTVYNQCNKKLLNYFGVRYYEI